MCEQLLFVEDDRTIIPILNISFNYQTSEFFDVDLSLKDITKDEIITTQKIDFEFLRADIKSNIHIRFKPSSEVLK